MSWQKMRLGDYCEVGRGSSPRPINDQRYFDNGNIPWVKIADATASSKYIFKTKYYVNDFGASFSRKLPPETLIVAASGTLGFPMFLGVEACIHDGWLYIDNLQNISKDFLYYKLITLQSYFTSKSVGAAIQNINTDILRDTEIYAPSIEKQNQIVSILKAYDDFIENNQRRMQLLEESARQLYQEWFVRLRFPGYEHTKIVKGIPEGWERLVAFDAMDVLSGGTPKTEISDYWDGDIPFYTPKDASDHIWVTDTERKLSEKGLNNCSSKFYPKETIFISARGTVGKIVMAQCPMAMSQTSYALIGKRSISQTFLFCAMKSSLEAFRQQAVGAVFDAIVVDTFRRIPFIIPENKIVRDFDEMVCPMFYQIENLVLQNNKLRDARDLLLPKLMNGEIEV